MESPARAAAEHRATAVPTGAGVRNPLDRRRRIRAVLFDLDGTLYEQRPLRVLMALELLSLSLAGPRRARHCFRALSAYRHAHETLRAMSAAGSVCEPQTQLALAASQSGLPLAELSNVVDEWMLRRPLKYLRWFRSRGLLELLKFLAARRTEAGVLSDYPPDAKLSALGLEGLFSLVLCSSDPDIGSLKPNPRGFLSACERWRLDPEEVLMVGDRVDADAAGAAAAGMPCVIIGRNAIARGSHLRLPSLERLHCALDDDC